MALKCSFLAYPESSVDIVWLVDYNHLQRHQRPAEPRGADRDTETNYRGRLPAEERFVVLYESRLYRTGDSSNNNSLVGNVDSSQVAPAEAKQADEEPKEDSKRRAFDEISLYNSRILIQESRAQIDVDDNSDHNDDHPTVAILKESQIIIQSVQADDSAR